MSKTPEFPVGTLVASVAAISREYPGTIIENSSMASIKNQNIFNRHSWRTVEWGDGKITDCIFIGFLIEINEEEYNQMMMEAL